MTTAYTMDDIGESTYTDGDRAGEQPQLKTGKAFEGRVASARVRVSKQGYLQFSMRIEALDAKARVMGSAFTQSALPLSFRGNAPGNWAKGIFADTISALYPEAAWYDSVSEDAVTKKKVFSKNGQVLTGPALQDAKGKAAQACEAIAKAMARHFVESGDKADITEVLDTTVYFTLATDATGEFVNVKNLSTQKPANVCYDRNEALDG